MVSLGYLLVGWLVGLLVMTRVMIVDVLIGCLVAGAGEALVRPWRGPGEGLGPGENLERAWKLKKTEKHVT